MSRSATMDLLAIARDAELDGHTADAAELRAMVDIDFAVDLAPCRTKLSSLQRMMRRMANKIWRVDGRVDGIQIIADPNVPLGRFYLMEATRDVPGPALRHHGAHPQALMHPTTLAAYERELNRRYERPSLRRTLAAAMARST